MHSEQIQEETGEKQPYQHSHTASVQHETRRNAVQNKKHNTHETHILKERQGQQKNNNNKKKKLNRGAVKGGHSLGKCNNLSFSEKINEYRRLIRELEG